MIREISIPVMDQTTESVVIIGWLVAEGDSVQKGDVLCEIETEKATVEIEATAEGVLRKILIEKGMEIPPLTVVALIGPFDEPLPDIDPYYRTSRAKAQAMPAQSALVIPKPTAPRATRPRKIVASPRAKRLARELRVDLTTVQGSGPNGRIQEDDVRAAKEKEAPTPSGSRLTQAKAERVSQSWQTIPHFYTAITVDMSQIVQAKAEADGTMTYTDYIALAIARTLGQHPALNAHWQDGGPVKLPTVHLGIVAQTERGLVIPAVRDIQDRSLTEIAGERARLVEQARAGKLEAAALIGPTFTLSNVGPGHIDHFTAVISPPQVAILTVGSIRPRPLVVGDELVIRPTATFTLAVDHRAIDGRQAAVFLEQLKENLESSK